MEEMKPCPFCGAEVDPPDWDDGDTFYCVEHKESCVMHDKWFRKNTVLTEHELKTWNTRHERTCHPKDKGEHLSGTDCPAWECSKCGELFEAGANFCSNCGARVIS